MLFRNVSSENLRREKDFFTCSAKNFYLTSNSGPYNKLTTTSVTNLSTSIRSIIKKILLLMLFPMVTSCFGKKDLDAFVSQFVKAGDLVFDVGAHIGNKAQLYVDQEAHVICIEPQPHCCTILRNRIAQNQVEII